MHDLSNYNVYVNKDGRTRAYDKETHAIVSYPKILMENILGRQLLSNEDVHHKDGNPLNNNPWNLVLINKNEHARMHANKSARKKWFDKEMVCPICGKAFIWTAKSQKEKARRKNNNLPCCSKECLSKSYQKNKEYDISDLQNLIYENSGNFAKVSKILGITENAIRHRLQKAGLPYHSSDYKI